MTKATHSLHRKRTKESVTMEDRLPLLLSFLLPVIIMIGIFAGKGIFPFGDNSFLRTDMYHQYAPFHAEFARLLKEGGSLTYSTEIGLGSNFVALFAYYLSSPFNWFLILVPSGAIIEFMTYIIVVKIGLCGLTMSYYLKSRFRKNDYALTVIALFYALSGYMAAYSWNIMWLDCLWLAPLIILGLEHLVRRNQPFLYCITLGLAILCNYYISIMLCIFMVLYFICEMILLPHRKPVEYLQKAILFGIFSLLAGGIAAILVLPAYRCLMTTASADSSFPHSLTSYFSFLEMIARHMVDVDVEIGLEHWPNIYSGVACMLLYPLYIINPKIRYKEKIVKSVLLAVMLLSFSLNIPNYIWHGMHYPNSLPCRQSFLYTIVLLTMCYEGLRKVRQLSPGQLLSCFWGDVIFILICQVVVTAEEFDYYVYYLSILFIGLYALLIYLVQTGKLLSGSALILGLAIVVVESGMNTAITSVTTTSRSEYWKNTRNYQALVEKAGELDTSGFFRVEKPSRRTKNDGAWADYSSASIFSSTTQSSVSDFYKSFGLEGNTNAYSFTGATPLMASLLSVRFMISATEQTENPLMEFAGQQGTAYLYRNKYTLPLGFMVPEETSGHFEYPSEEDPAGEQNKLVQVTADLDEVLVQEAENYDTDEMEFTVENPGRYYVYVDNPDIEDVTVYINDTHKSFENVDRGYFLDLGYLEEEAEISLISDDSEGYPVDAIAYRFDEEVFTAWYDKMSKQGMAVESFENSFGKTELVGKVNALTEGMLFTSLPYDEGWTITVDGIEYPTQTFAKTFLAVYLPAGMHEIVMNYRVPGLMEGFLLTLSSILILVLLGIALYIRREQKSSDSRHFRGKRTSFLSKHSGYTPGSHESAADSGSSAEHDTSSEPEVSPENHPEPPASDRTARAAETAPAEKTGDHVLSDDDIAEILLEDEEFLNTPDTPSDGQ